MILTNAFATISRALRSAFSAVKEFRREHPILFASLVGASIGLTLAILLPPVMGAIGFGAIGPVAGTLAPQLQSAIYGAMVTQGSLFAIMQSWAMVGMPPMVYAAGGLLGGLAGAIAAAARRRGG